MEKLRQKSAKRYKNVPRRKRQRVLPKFSKLHAGILQLARVEK
jgi:hypothetical protein